MRVYNLNKLRLVLLGAVLSLSLITLTFMKIKVQNVTNDLDTRTDDDQQFIKVPLALSLLWTKSNVLRGDYGDYNRNEIIGDNEPQEYNDYDQYYSDDSALNQAFKEGDFDTNTTTSSLPLPLFQSPLKVIITGSPVPKKVMTEEGLYWSQWMENRLPKGLTDKDVSTFQNRVKVSKVRRVEAPTWNKCGRPDNQFVVLDDGTQLCARYRHPHQYLVLGEVMSFYLSRLLGIANVPTVTLANTSDNMWANVWNQSLSKVWRLNTTVALIEWIDDLERDRMPSLILSSLISNTTLHTNDRRLMNLTTNQLVELMQWSDLLLFDYITGNYDRVASMQDEALKQHNNTILNETIHNLVKSSQTKSIWMIDNESGFLDAYWLMYSPKNGNESEFFRHFHHQVLSANCIFRRSTIEHLTLLRSHPNPNKLLIDFIAQYEPSFRRQLLPIKSDYLRYFSQYFGQRIDRVFKHFQNCKVI